MKNNWFYVVEIQNGDLNVISKHTDISHAAYRIQFENRENRENRESDLARPMTILVMENNRTRKITESEETVIRNIIGFSPDPINSKIKLPDLSNSPVIIRANAAIAALETAIASCPDISTEQMIHTIMTLESLDKITDEMNEKSDDWICSEIFSKLERVYNLIQKLNSISPYTEKQKSFPILSPDDMMNGVEDLIRSVEDTRNSENPEQKRIAFDAMSLLYTIVELIDRNRKQMNSDESGQYASVLERIYEFTNAIEF